MKSRQQSEEPRGLEKQKAKKTEQMKKERGQGTQKEKETGEKSRKWWKFWGNN